MQYMWHSVDPVPLNKSSILSVFPSTTSPTQQSASWFQHSCNHPLSNAITQNNTNTHGHPIWLYCSAFVKCCSTCRVLCVWILLEFGYVLSLQQMHVLVAIMVGCWVNAITIFSKNSINHINSHFGTYCHWSLEAYLLKVTSIMHSSFSSLRWYGFPGPSQNSPQSQ